MKAPVRTLPLLLLAPLVASAAAPAAEAGMRVSLGFGGPLPVFTAHGPGHGQAHGSHRYRPAKKHHAAHSAKGKKSAYGKKATPRSTVSASKNAALKEPSAALKAAPGKTTDRLAEATSGTGSSAPINADATIHQPPVSLTNSIGGPSEAQSAPELAAISAVTTTSIATDVASADTEAADAAASAVVGKHDCKKFFPSVGLTLTVACE